MHDFLLELALLDWLLGQEEGLPGCSDAGIDFLLAGYSDSTAAVEETASGIAAAGSDADAGAISLRFLSVMIALSIRCWNVGKV